MQSIEKIHTRQEAKMFHAQEEMFWETLQY